MTVVCAGMMSSGTRMLTYVVEIGLGLPVHHLSMPTGPVPALGEHNAGTPLQWWDWRWWPEARFVVITRRSDVVVKSLMARADLGMVTKDEKRLEDYISRASKALAVIPGAIWVSYEAFVADPIVQVDNLARALGVEVQTYDLGIFDGNEKWLL